MLARSTMTLFMMAIFLAMLAIASTYPAGSRFMVLVVGIPAVALCLLQLIIDFTRGPSNKKPFSEAGLGENDEDEMPPSVMVKREIIVWGFFLSFIAIVLFFGFWVAVPLLLFTFLWLQAGVGFLKSFLTAAIATPVLFVFFEKLLETQLHRGFWTPQILEELAKVEAVAPYLKLLGLI